MPLRKASLHIYEEDLKGLFIQFFDESGNELPCAPDDLVNYIMIKGKQLQILSRSELGMIKKEQNKVERIVGSATGDAQLFATTYYSLRLKAHHRGITRIREGTTEWQFVKEGAKLANEFEKSFEYTTKKEAYIVYIRCFMALVNGSPSLRRINSLHEKIMSRMEANESISRHPNIEQIGLMHDHYQRKVFEKTGNNFDYKNTPEQFIHFALAYDHAMNIGLSPNQFVDAQFEAMDFASAIPYPTQLSNEKASERAIRWMAQNSIKKHNSQTKEGLDRLNKLKAIAARYENNP